VRTAHDAHADGGSAKSHAAHRIRRSIDEGRVHMQSMMRAAWSGCPERGRPRIQEPPSGKKRAPAATID